MKKILFILFTIASLSAFGQAQSDASLSTQSTDEIKNKAINQTRIDAFNQDLVLSKSSNVPTANTQTGNYTLALTDIGKTVIMNVGSANDLTVPPNSSVAFPVGTMIVCFQNGAGTTTVEPGVGVTVNNTAGNFDAPAQYAPFVLHKTATDTWTLSNGLTGGGGGGITNGAASNEIMKSDGTNAVASGIFSTASGEITTGTWSGSDIGFSRIAQGTALSLLGVAGNSTADNASIAAGTDNQVMRRSGTSIGFGAVNIASSDAITGTLAVGNGGTGITSLGTGVATFLGTPSSANLATAVTDEIGSGPLTFNGWVQGGNTLTGNQIFGDISGTGFNVDFYTQNVLKMRLHGTGTTFLSMINASSQNIHRFISDGSHLVGTAGALVSSASSAGAISATGNYARVSGGGVWLVSSGANTATPTSNAVAYVSGAITANGTSELGAAISNRATFINTAQTGVSFYANQGTYVVNTTGGSSSVYGFYDNPTLTSTTGATLYGSVVHAVKRNGFGAGSAPSAQLHLGASTTAASTASLKIDEGSRQTSAEDGTINYVSNNLEFVETSTVYTLAKTLTNTATLNFDLTSVNSEDLTITVTGASAGDAVSVGVDAGSATANVIYTWWVSATNTVTVRASRIDVATGANPASGTFRAAVIHY